MSRPAPLAPLLSARHLKVSYRPRGFRPWRRAPVTAVEELHLDLRASETLGIVGEAGAGKSALAQALAGLQAPDSGSIRYSGRELAGLSKKDWRTLRREIRLLTAKPLAGLGSRHSVGDFIAAPLHELSPELGGPELAPRVAATLERLGLPAESMHAHPHEFPGLAALCVGLAHATIVPPRVLICDEPGAELAEEDLQRLLVLLADVQREHGFAMAYLTRDPAAARRISHRIAVMYLGHVVEQAAAEDLFEHPAHPYTRSLLGSDAASAKAKVAPEMGCVFHPRCPLMEASCVRSAPGMRRTGADHYAACHFVAAPGGS
ncbi:MAG TPA: oligopeptide/dipeptide ABC transporter ATP-binding protein [Nevskia sp.]|nr:oligopeptide/dipeptide ABC transporter ATP-binding protein [Nevskia sp.]